MARFRSNARFAVVLAVVMGVFLSGVVAGAAGSPLILGVVNDAGASATKVLSSVNGNAFAVAQTGSGASANGIRGDANTGTGGVFTSSTNNALFATAASANRFAMVAVSNGGAGTGGALYADGNANPALDITTNSGVAPMTVDSTTTVANLSSDLLDGWQANSLTRHAFQVTADSAYDGVDGPTGTVISAAITAPTRGWLHVVASADSYNYTASDDVTCYLKVGDSFISGSLRYMDLNASNREQDCVTNAGVQTCGGTSTVSVIADSVAATTNFQSASIDVLYTPFDGSGNGVPFLECAVITPLAVPDLDPDRIRE